MHERILTTENSISVDKENKMADLIENGVHAATEEKFYVEPKDPYIRERLEWFRDQKLALMMHFGPFSQLDVDCSWPLSDADASWSRKEVDWESDPEVFRKQYFDLNKSFNPVRFQPDKWAEFAAENGFKYLIFTTKHHDGFCMFDTKYTDYKVTSPDCPFHTHKYANIVREVFDAFRNKGIAIGAYFSKPDWHCPWYWAEGMEHPIGFDRNPTYWPPHYPEVWNKFTEFVHNQVMELIEEYGRIDILWLDGGQVNLANRQDIKLTELIEKARKVQPWLISVDRLGGMAGGAENENYVTPEQKIPDHVIHAPWESCVTIGNKWIHGYNETYKTSRQLVLMLIQTVSYGGNLALNIGPQPDGRLPERALKEVAGLGSWLKVNGDAIYGTRALEDPQSGNIYYTKKGDSVYAIMSLEEGEQLGETVLIPLRGDVKKITCLGCEGELSFRKTEDGALVVLPREIVGTNPYAVAFELK